MCHVHGTDAFFQGQQRPVDLSTFTTRLPLIVLSVCRSFAAGKVDEDQPKDKQQGQGLKRVSERVITGNCPLSDIYSSTTSGKRRVIEMNCC